MQNFRVTKRARCGAAQLFFVGLILGSVAGCGGGTCSFFGGISLRPKTATLGFGQTETFQAQVLQTAPDSCSDVQFEGVSWKIKEGDAGGTIVVDEANPSGDTVIYTAPQTQGVYHIQATARYSNGSKTDTAAVEVK